MSLLSINRENREERRGEERREAVSEEREENSREERRQKNHFSTIAVSEEVDKDHDWVIHFLNLPFNSLPY